MSIVHIETHLTGRKQFEFVETWIDLDGNCVEERTYTETHDDRMYAAMTNLGYACRWLNDAAVHRGAVCIVSDRDGLDKRYGGEHDDLYYAIHSQHEYERNRAKYGLIYGKYLGYLDRIRELANLNEITFTQNANPFLGVATGRREVIVDPNDFTLRCNQNFTRDNLIKLDLTRRIARCNWCGAEKGIPQKDEFAPFKEWQDNGRAKTVKTNTKLLQNFLDRHVAAHGIK